MPAEDLDWAITDLKDRAPALATRRAYYEGDHARVLPEGKTLSPLMKALLDDLSDNLCDDVVDEPVSRLHVTTWTATSPGLADAANDLWERNRGTARARDVHRNTYRAGDGFVILQRDAAQQVRWYAQNPAQMAVRYSLDDPDTIEVAAKAWRVGKRWRINLYYADGRIERYATRGSSADGGMPQARQFSPVHLDDGFGDPVEYTEDRRMPVHHLPNDEVGRYGRSVLTDVIPLQNLLNKSVADLVVAMEKHALPDRYATGIQVEYDANGQEVNPFTSGRTWRTGNDKATFGQFQQADLTQFLKVQETYRLRIAHKGYLPLHSVRIEGDASAPSGVSLLVAEGRQVKRVKATQQEGGLFWREVQAHALSLATNAAVAPEDLECEWAPAETRDEAALVETLTIKVESLGLPKRQALLECGYDAEDVDEWMDDAEAAREAMPGGRLSPPGATGLLPTPPGAPVGVPAPGGIGLSAVAAG
jgi:hypothetical protein